MGGVARLNQFLAGLAFRTGRTFGPEGNLLAAVGGEQERRADETEQQGSWHRCPIYHHWNRATICPLRGWKNRLLYGLMYPKPPVSWPFDVVVAANGFEVEGFGR